MPRAARRRPWIAADEDRRHVLRLVARYRDRFAFALYYDCLMDNHFHLLLQLPDPRKLPLLMAGLLLSYGHHDRRRYRLVGHLVQGRFKSPTVEAEASLLSWGRSIERNPLEAGLVAVPWEYRASSPLRPSRAGWQQESEPMP